MAADPADGIFIVENLMAHEERIPDDIPEQACSLWDSSMVS